MNPEKEIIENLRCPCGASYEYKYTPSKVWTQAWYQSQRPEHCQPCQEELDRQHDLRIEERREQERINRINERIELTKKDLRRATPPRFLATDITHPSFNRKAWEKISAWRPTEERPWLGLVGASGTSKTRMSYLLATQIVIETAENYCDMMNDTRKPTFVFLCATDMRRIITDSFTYEDAAKKNDAIQALDRMLDCSVLLIDDLGKGKFSPSVAEGFFRILNHRHDHNLTTIWTANSTPEALARMLPEAMLADMAGPFAGRLIECSHICNLK